MTASARLIRSVTGRDTLDGYTFDDDARPTRRPVAAAPVTAQPVQSTHDLLMARSAEINAVSPKQQRMIDWKMDVLAKIDPDGAQAMREWLVKHRAELTGGYEGTASDVIDRLKRRIDAIEAGTIVVSRPDQTAPAAPARKSFDDYADVTDGNYAIERAGKTHFYRITRKAGKGRFEGRTFTNIQERASDELFDVRTPWPVRKSILDEIRAAGVTASHLMYSERLGRCWHCNILLTDDVTNPYRPYGLGPVCGPKVMG